MSERPIEIREVRASDAEAFAEAAAAFVGDPTEFEFAFHYDPATNFSAYAEALRQQSADRDLPAGYVPHTFLIGVVGPTIVGRVSLRHELNDFLLNYGGHIGYGVCPAHRRRGYATALLADALGRARERGLARALVTCDEDNIPSIAIIERAGGVLEDCRRPPSATKTKRRYWIPLGGPAAVR